jgi:hypothetical protein
MQPGRRMNPDQSLEALEARLRALPPPDVPADLESRLLAAIPVAVPMRRRHWPVWVAVGAMAAACLLAVLIWPRRYNKPFTPIQGPPEIVEQKPPNLANGRDFLGAPEMSTFTWPVNETIPLRASTSIPAYLLD